MELTITRKITVEENVIAQYLINGECTDIDDAIHKYIAPFDDEDYYLFGEEEYDKIGKVVKQILNKIPDKTFYFEDKETGEEFFVQAKTKGSAKQIAAENFYEPRLISEVPEQFAEEMGLDTYSYTTC